MQELIHTKIHELGVIMKLDAKLYQLHNPCNQFLSFTSVNVSKSLVFDAQAERMVLEHQFHS